MFNNLNVKLIAINQPYPQSSALVKLSTVSDDVLLDHEEGMTADRSKEELIVTDALPWQGRALSSFTMYGELYAAHVQEEFAPVRIRLQQEWIFVAGFVSRFIILFFCRFPANSLFDVKLVALSSYVFSLIFFADGAS